MAKSTQAVFFFFTFFLCILFAFMLHQTWPDSNQTKANVILALQDEVFREIRLMHFTPKIFCAKYFCAFIIHSLAVALPFISEAIKDTFTLSCSDCRAQLTMQLKRLQHLKENQSVPLVSWLCSNCYLPLNEMGDAAPIKHLFPTKPNW